MFSRYKNEKKEIYKMYSNYPMSLFDRQKFVFNMTDDVNERLEIQHRMMLNELNNIIINYSIHEQQYL